MKILQLHNYYQQAGGEDAVVAAERAALEAAGHEVIPFYTTNEEIPAGVRGTVASRLRAIAQLLKVSAQTVWNAQVYRAVRAIIRRERPDVVHCHNLFPRLSPAVYWACAAERVPVVQTLHNYRLLCLNANLFRLTGKTEHGGSTGSVCEKCMGRFFKWPGIVYGCYRGSHTGSAVVALALWIHRLLGTWTKKVDRYVALTEFQRRKLIAGGVPEDLLIVKPNGVILPGDQDPSPADECPPPLPYALFVGRLSAEKGVDQLIHAWARCMDAWSDRAPPRLIIVGDGPQRDALERLAGAVGTYGSVRLVGAKDRAHVYSYMRHASFLIMPSRWYETFGLVVIEAGLLGVPALVASPSAAAELISDGETGLAYPRDDLDGLVQKMLWAFDHPANIQEMGQRAARAFRQQFSVEQDAARLLVVYEQVIP